MRTTKNHPAPKVPEQGKASDHPPVHRVQRDGLGGTPKPTKVED